MAAGFLVPHHHGEDFIRREIVAGLVEEQFRIGLEHARNEARPHLRAAGIAPVELKAKPQTGLPSRMTSVITATTEVVISEKSMLELASVEFSGTAVSRISTIRIERRYSFTEPAESWRRGSPCPICRSLA